MGGIISKPKAPTPPPTTPGQKAAQNIASGGNPATAYAAGLSPTTAEVSQASATDMDNKGIKRRRRGRSMTILTGSAGVQEGATLGTPTLLG
jgi:hypothetical protein